MLLNIFASFDWTLLEEITRMELAVAAGLVGLLIGSFLNVLIERLPRDASITRPRSRCFSCETPLKIYDSIPVFSFLFLRGKCRYCRIQIPYRYLIVEALTALLFAGSAYLSGISWLLPFALIFISLIIALIFIDAEHMLLPNALTYPGIAICFVARLVVPKLYGVGFLLTEDATIWTAVGLSFLNSVAGALVGGGSLWLVGWLWERARGVEAMGLGDVKMMFMVGAFFGWPLTLLTLFIAFVAGALSGLVLLIWRRERSLQVLIPFGIFLGAASLISLFFGGQIMDWYARSLGWT